MANGKRLILPPGAAVAAQADTAAQEEAQRVAGATAYALGSLLDRVAAIHPDQSDAVLAGAIAALVRFTFERCWSETRPRLAGELLNRWGPMMMAGVVSAVKERADG